MVNEEMEVICRREDYIIDIDIPTGQYLELKPLSMDNRFKMQQLCRRADDVIEIDSLTPQITRNDARWLKSNQSGIPFDTEGPNGKASWLSRDNSHHNSKQGQH